MTELTNETKIIIEGKEFTLIKYSCGDNDRWFCEELGIMIVKQEKLDKTISWQSMYDRETEQLKKLIGFGEDEVAKWKNKVEKLVAIFPNPKAGKSISDEYYYYQARLQRA